MSDVVDGTAIEVPAERAGEAAAAGAAMVHVRRERRTR
jgi:uncharacterized protein (DUF849 family)